MSDEFTLGEDCMAYRSAALLDGSTVTPALATWVEMENIRSVDLSLTKSEVDVSSRANSGWKATAFSQKDGTIQMEMLWLPGDAAFEAIQAAWLANTEVAMAFMDGPIATVGSQGLAANFSIGTFSRSEPLEGAVIASVTAKPSSQIAWYKKAGS